MSKIRIPSRFDSKLADDGVWFEVYDELENFYGSFLCALIDFNSPRTAAKVAQYNKKAERQKNVPGYKERANAEMFVEISLLDWKDVPSEDGKPVKYSAIDAIDYLVQSPFLLNELYGRAASVVNYAPLDKAEAVKN